MKEMVGGCCVCSDDRGWPENPLVYCDGQSCTVAVHQACYGIVTVPTGPWYCRKCESQERAARVKCELCPSRDGALKRTDNGGWAHVVCALYIPEVRFGNVTTMEPIILALIPPERYSRNCYICEELGKASRAAVGACMQCNKSGCRQQFHVTCAQALGLLCEEAGNYLDNVKYCGYCQHHYSKLRKGGNVKTIPPYKPIPADNHSSDSSPEKEADVNSPASKPTASSSSSSSLNATSSKRKSSSGSKSSSSSTAPKSSSSSTGSGSKSSSSSSKTVHSSSSSSSTKNAEKTSSKSSSSATSSSSASKSAASKSLEVDSGSSGGAAVTTASTNSLTANDSTQADLNKSSSNEVIVDHKSDSNLSTSSVKSASKKRKANSRTPTPNNSASVVHSVAASGSVADNKTDTDSKSSVVVSVGLAAPTGSAIVGNSSASSNERRDSVGSGDVSLDKSKKVKTEHSSNSSSVPPSISSQPSSLSDIHSTPSSATTHVIQPPQTVNSLLVSVPLSSTSLSPTLNPANQQHIVNNPGLTGNSSSSFPSVHLPQQNPTDRSGRSTPASGGGNTPGVLSGVSTSSNMVNTDLGSGGLKITYEKQTTPVPMEIDTSVPSVEVEAPSKRGRSQSTESSKVDKVTRNKKRGPNGAQSTPAPPIPVVNAHKRASRSQHSTPPPASTTPNAFNNLASVQIKDSPPSSPNSESASAPVGRKSKGRKSNSSSSNMSSSLRETKDIKLFQNGIHAPHMMGNQLNPNSNMAQKMTDHLNSELEAHSIFSPNELSGNLVGPQLPTRNNSSVRSSSAGGSSTGSGGGGSSGGGGGAFSMLGGGGGTIPQTLDQLLERQWEQGSQFLMEQAQHFDIASLLSCLHQLRAENSRLEDRVSSLLQRRDHLLAVNARLAIPLTGQPGSGSGQQQGTAGSGSQPHPHTVNNIHPSVSAAAAVSAPPPLPAGGHMEPQRSRHSYSSSQGQPIENGLPADTSSSYPHQHRSPANSQPSPNIRHSPVVSGYSSNSGMVRQQSGSESGRSAPRPPYPQYPGPTVTPHQQSQMVIRRESDHHHQLPSSKPS